MPTEESKISEQSHGDVQLADQRLQTDYSTQFKFAKLLEDGKDIILTALKEIALECHDSTKYMGLLVVFGTFDNHDGKVFGVVQMGPNPITSYKNISDDDFKETLVQLGQYDGAILVNRTGQIIAARTYLVVDNPNIVSEEECGTKHRAAASFSLRQDIHNVFTMSEETLKVRQWCDGDVECTYDPSKKEEADSPAPKRGKRPLKKRESESGEKEELA